MRRIPQRIFSFLKPNPQRKNYNMDRKQDPNNHLQSAELCCMDHESIFVAKYSSGRTWILCNNCIDDEAFKLGLKSRTRISS